MFIPDGFSTLVAFNPGGVNIFLYLRERQVQPPSLSLGGGIDTSNMRNRYMRTMAPKSLVTLGEMTVQAYYDPFVYSQMLGLIEDADRFLNLLHPGGQPGQHLILGKVGAIQVYFPDGAVWPYYGWIDSLTPPAHKEGEFPEMEVKFLASNRDPATGLEMKPVIIPGNRPGVVTR